MKVKILFKIKLLKLENKVAEARKYRKIVIAEKNKKKKERQYGSQS